jgi:hypothetical protein
VRQLVNESELPLCAGRGDTTWLGIWLDEGFATWSEWIWSERQGNKSAHKWFEQLYPRVLIADTPAKDTGFLGLAVADFTDPALLFKRDGLLPRRNDAAGAAREDR